jgi:hypothetical protein
MLNRVCGYTALAANVLHDSHGRPRTDRLLFSETILGERGRQFEGAAIVVYGRLRSIFLIRPRKFGI